MSIPLTWVVSRLKLSLLRSTDCEVFCAYLFIGRLQKLIAHRGSLGQERDFPQLPNRYTSPFL